MAHWAVWNGTNPATLTERCDVSPGKVYSDQLRMAQRRDRPPVQRSGDSLDVHLGGGRTMSVPLEALRGLMTPEVCCFCGQVVKDPGSEHLSLAARWEGGSGEGTQSWAAHRACLAERIHDTVKGTGPFFGL